MPVLIGDSFVLRPFREGDAETLPRAANNPKVWRNLGHAFPHPYTREAAEKWIADCASATENNPRMAIEIDGLACGGIGLHPVALWSPYTFEMGYWLGEEHWGRGVMTRAVSLVVAHAFAHLEAERVQAYVFEWNPGSRRVLEKNGFELEGRLRRAVHKDGRWGDCLAYGRLR